jgi:hypothetical protein
MDPKYIVEEVRHGDKLMDCSREDLVHTVLHFYNAGDEEGARGLVKAFEEGISNTSDNTEREARSSARDSIDFLCKTADEYLKNGCNMHYALWAASFKKRSKEGSVERFYSDAVERPSAEPQATITPKELQQILKKP